MDEDQWVVMYSSKLLYTCSMKLLRVVERVVSACRVTVW